MVKEIIRKVGAQVEHYLEESQKGNTPALNQQAPEHIAQDLKLKKRFQ